MNESARPASTTGVGTAGETGGSATVRKIQFHRPSIGAAERDAVIEVLDSRWLTTGQKSVAFEEAIKARLGCGHAVAVNSATAALHLILEALGIREGDEVVVPTYTFAACGETVRYLKARPRLADVDPVTFNATAETIEAQLRPETKAIMVVHFGGLMADMEPILELARGRNLPVIEDAAHALPCSRDGREAGTVGTAGALSFYATKTVTTGEGGMLVTDSAEIANRARSMRLHGLTRDAWKRYSGGGSWYYEIEDAGFKYNLTDLAAAIGLVQLDRAEAMRVEREAVARRYAQAFAASSIANLVQLPVMPRPNEVHAWHLYPIRLQLDRIKVTRAEAIDRLAEAGVGTSVHFIPLHLHPYYRRTYGYAPADLPVARLQYEREISLPIYPGLTDAEVDYVVERLAGILLPS
ncbi:MAG: DegT/DnrJ/EryC1/StrS family aminotransferase [Candidatus Limnocylindrales bacterium]|jgi:perosamine synthetase